MTIRITYPNGRPPANKAIELEFGLADSVSLYESFADRSTWQQIEPRLVMLQSTVLKRLHRVDDIWYLTPEQFEHLVRELLEEIGFSVLWIPGGKDGGIDIVEGSGDRRFLIDVKRYATSQPVTVELVRGFTAPQSRLARCCQARLSMEEQSLQAYSRATQKFSETLSGVVLYFETATGSRLNSRDTEVVSPALADTGFQRTSAPEEEEGLAAQRTH